ncbi:hypothetical protein ACN38_g11863 [Penicillium nordicum]|uniref:Uncharacterized protein n=1 Tax=Penicillium nordicum TaxID=229535 RepID=A0A0M8NQI7_9EURO|nr:hypothetical protein ACN38_g11863 [Penicillium nordicum]
MPPRIHRPQSSLPAANVLIFGWAAAGKEILARSMCALSHACYQSALVSVSKKRQGLSTKKKWQGKSSTYLGGLPMDIYIIDKLILSN